MASLLNMSGGSLLKKGLPYDYEVEYLEGASMNRTTFIYEELDSKIRFGQTFKVKFKNGVIGSTIAGGSGLWLLKDNTPWRENTNFNIGSYETKVYLDYFLRQPDRTFTSPVDKVCYYEFGNNYIKDLETGSVLANQSIISTAQLGSNTLLTSFQNGFRIYSIEVIDNNVTIIHLIPVVKGNVGYMYDKVSGQLFGNAGTGSFIVGPRV